MGFLEKSRDRIAPSTLRPLSFMLFDEALHGIPYLHVTSLLSRPAFRIYIQRSYPLSMLRKASDVFPIEPCSRHQNAKGVTKLSGSRSFSIDYLPHEVQCSQPWNPLRHGSLSLYHCRIIVKAFDDNTITNNISSTSAFKSRARP